MATTTNTSQPLYFALFLFFILHTASGYTTNLIHRDSPQSPFYNPSSTPFDRLHDAFRRSLDRASNFQSAIDVPINLMKPGGGDYLMKMSIGTPMVDIIGVVDTGSYLTWTQCLPCVTCYKQNLLMYDPTNSSSYKDILCESDTCQRLRPQDCDDDPKARCDYLFNYGDASHTEGNLASEIVTLSTTTKGSLSILDFLFGCSHDTAGTFTPAMSGIIGLSRSNFSLVSQLGGNKLSYCFVPDTAPDSNSVISFGDDAVVSGDGVVTTPLAKRDTNSLYYLTLEAISVGNERVPFVNPNAGSGEGNIIIDTGSTLTLVPPAVHSGLVSALDKVLAYEKVDDPNGQLSPCYKNVNMFDLPIITAHFRGADVVLHQLNTFSVVKDHVVCFTVHGNNVAVYGNMAQMNFLVGYDIEAGTVSFKPTDCTTTNQH